MVDLSFECLEQMDKLIYQSGKGIHLLFEKSDIIRAIKEGEESQDEYDIDKLKKIQEILYEFISMKEVSEKKEFIGTLSAGEFSLLIRAYFKIVDNSLLNQSQIRH